MLTCEICQSTNFKLIATQMREGPCRICQCGKCGLVMLDLTMSEEELKGYYNQDYQLTNSLTAGEKESAKEHFKHRLETVEPYLEHIRPLLKPHQHVLDVGCGAGELMHSIKPLVQSVTGTDLNEDFVQFIKKDLHFDAYAKDISEIDFKGKKFDLIMSINTIDHMPHPFKALQTFRQILAPGGSVFLMVPNLDEALNNFLPPETQEKFRTFFYHKAHFHYFNKETLALILKKAGFESNLWSFHEYTLVNFLRWFFAGRPTPLMSAAVNQIDLIAGNGPFEKEINKIFREIEPCFRKIMAENMRGDILCCQAKPLENT